MGGSKRVSTKHVVLGLMIERRGYGYDLQQRIEERLGFLGLSETSVYRLLDRLEADGFIIETARVASGGTRRGLPRVTYEATPAGVEEFHRWMRAPSPPAVVREELHAKLTLAGDGDLPALIAETQEHEADCLARLRALARRTPLHELADGTLPWPQVAALLVDDALARRLQATVDWLQGVRVVMRRRLEAGAARRTLAPGS